MTGMFVIWLIFIIVVVAKSKNNRLGGRVWSTPLPPEQPRTPEEIARERYARGEIAWPEYQEVLVNLLKDRYVSGELELDEYEQRASLVLDGTVSGHGQAATQLPSPSEVDGSQPRGPEPAAAPEPLTVEPARSVTREPEIADPGAPATPPETTDTAQQRRQILTDSALDALRRRFLNGELTPDEYEEQCRRLMAA